MLLLKTLEVVYYLLNESENVVINLLKDSHVTTSSCLQPMILESSSNNIQKQLYFISNPINAYQEEINNDKVDSVSTAENKKESSLAINKILAGQSLKQPEIISSKNFILKEISPLPKSASTGKLRVKRKTGGSQVFTSSPFMSEIKAAVQQKKEKENRRTLKKQMQTKRVIFEDDDVEFKPASKKFRAKKDQRQIKPIILDNDNNLKKRKVKPDPGPKKHRPSRTRKQKQHTIVDNDDDLEDPYANEDEGESGAACIYCNELFSQSKPKELWVRCQLCSKWCHTLCASVLRKTKQYICELCL